MLRLLCIVLAVGVVLNAAALAAESGWPTELKIGGFRVVNIRAGGPVTAAGSLEISGLGAGQRVSLTRAPSGEVTGSVQFSFRLSGVEFHGSGALSSAGLRASGMVHSQPKPVSDAVFSVEIGGRFQGEGRLALNSLWVPVKVSLSPSAFGYSGSVPVQSESDNPLASYRFDGTLNVEGGATRLTVTASGTVTRKGKLVDQVTRQAVSRIPVSLSDGSGSAEIGGVSVRFRFF